MSNSSWTWLVVMGLAVVVMIFGAVMVMWGTETVRVEVVNETGGAVTGVELVHGEAVERVGYVGQGESGKEVILARGQFWLTVRWRDAEHGEHEVRLGDYDPAEVAEMRVVLRPGGEAEVGEVAGNDRKD